MYKNLLVKCYEQNLQKNDEYLDFINMMTANEQAIKKYNLKTTTYKRRNKNGN